MPEDRPARGCSAASARRSSRARPAAGRAARPEAPRHDQRARRLAQAGGQRGGHQHADERALQRVAALHPHARQRGAQDRVPAQRRARPSRGTSARGRASTHHGLAFSRLAPILSMPIRCSASSASPTPSSRRGDRRRRGARACAARLCDSATGGSSDGRLAVGLRARQAVGRAQPGPHGEALDAAVGRGARRASIASS